MPSPFPGMNPFLEQSDVWQEFHGNLIYQIRDILIKTLELPYLVRVGTRFVSVEINFDAPVTKRLPKSIKEKHHWVEIRDQDNKRVVTFLELLSPINEAPGSDRNEYLTKRNEVLASKAHFVEIDLRRGGRRPNMPSLPKCDYYALISRYEDRPDVGIWPFGLREPLPVLPLPLDGGKTIALDLKTVLDLAYDGGGYERTIYQEKPEPRLSPEQAAWAKQFIPKQLAG